MLGLGHTALRGGGRTCYSLARAVRSRKLDLRRPHEGAFATLVVAVACTAAPGMQLRTAHEVCSEETAGSSKLTAT